MINKKKSDIRVHVHEHNLLKSDGEEAYYVKTIHIHPLFLNPGSQDYSYADGDGDFALLQLEYPVTKQRYICLPSPGNSYISTQAITAGWGLDETGRTPDIPRHVGLVTITNQECQGKMVRTITDNMICATYKGQGEFASACPGDSGSPLMVGETIIGVASIAQGCKPIIKGRPTVFARVTSQLTWIKKYVTNACTG